MRNSIRKMFAIAELTAEMGDCKEASRSYRLGAVGIRRDGVMVAASNIAVRQPTGEAHAEYRLCRKLTPQSVVFVVRLTKNGWGMARPCKKCAQALANIDNVCWVCDEPIDKSKPVKPISIEGTEEDIKRLDKQNSELLK